MDLCFYFLCAAFMALFASKNFEEFKENFFGILFVGSIILFIILAMAVAGC